MITFFRLQPRSVQVCLQLCVRTKRCYVSSELICLLCMQLIWQPQSDSAERACYISWSWRRNRGEIVFSPKDYAAAFELSASTLFSIGKIMISRITKTKITWLLRNRKCDTDKLRKVLKKSYIFKKKALFHCKVQNKTNKKTQKSEATGEFFSDMSGPQTRLWRCLPYYDNYKAG